MLRAALTDDWQAGGFGLYLHWPYCESKCPYCDFNSHVAREIDQSRWKAAYLSEIDRYAEMLPGRVLTSVFFGGGTPSLMDPDLVAAILDRIRSRWPVSNSLETTLEANPGSVEAGRFASYAEAGVNRISMGIQALNDADLKRLGRVHTVAEAKQAFEIARKKFDRVSFDLIYARQGQSLRSWRKELSEALSMAVDHLSLYQLTIEPGTAFGERYAKGGLKGLPEDDTAAEMYDTTQEVCTAAGFEAYEVSNHAKSGAESRHNLVYWRYGDYVGIGPGAHGRITMNGQRYETEAWSNPDKWLTGSAVSQTEKTRSPVTQDDQAAEFLLMGLRLSEGLSLDRYRKIAGCSLPEDKIDHLVSIGMICVSGDRLAASKQGRLVLNSVIRELLTG